MLHWLSCGIGLLTFASKQASFVRVGITHSLTLAFLPPLHLNAPDTGKEMGSAWRLVRDGLGAILALTESGVFWMQGPELVRFWKQGRRRRREGRRWRTKSNVWEG